MRRPYKRDVKISKGDDKLGRKFLYTEYIRIGEEC